MNEKKDLFDALGDALKYVVAPVSGVLTGKLLASTLGFDGFDEKLIVIATAALFTVMEILLFRQYAKTKETSALVLGILIATMSIGGSVGYFNVKLQENIVNSDEYQLAKHAYENALNASDPEKNPTTYLVGRKNLPAAQAKFESVRFNGAGVGNAFYQQFSRITGWSLEDSALAITIFIAFVIELILIYGAMTHDRVPKIKSDKSSFVDRMKTKFVKPSQTPAAPVIVAQDKPKGSGMGFQASLSPQQNSEKKDIPVGFASPAGDGTVETRVVVIEKENSDKPNMRELNKKSREKAAAKKEANIIRAKTLKSNGKKVSEIANIMGKTETTIRSYLS